MWIFLVIVALGVILWLEKVYFPQQEKHNKATVEEIKATLKTEGLSLTTHEGKERFSKLYRERVLKVKP